MYVRTSVTILFCLVAARVDAGPSTALYWATECANEQNVRRATACLGDPGRRQTRGAPWAVLGPGADRSASGAAFSNFDDGSEYRTTSLADAFGLTDEEFGSFDFVAFEVQSMRNPHHGEEAHWKFDDAGTRKSYEATEGVQTGRRVDGGAGIRSGVVAAGLFNALFGTELRGVKVGWMLVDLGDSGQPDHFGVEVSSRGGFGANPDILGMAKIVGAPVPEPATFGLVGAGLAIAAWSRRRRSPERSAAGEPKSESGSSC